MCINSSHLCMDHGYVDQFSSDNKTVLINIYPKVDTLHASLVPRLFFIGWWYSHCKDMTKWSMVSRAALLFSHTYLAN